MAGEQLILVVAIAALVVALIVAASCGVVATGIARRVDRIERSRAAASTSPMLARIIRSVDYTEGRTKREDALMAAIDTDAPVQLYRREGSRFVAHGERS